jgi:hypothetical protein
MRYRDGLDAAGQALAAQTSLTQGFVTATVWMTLFIGILFTVVGVRAQQRWLVFWGGLTVLMCAGYGVYAVA